MNAARQALRLCEDLLAAVAGFVLLAMMGVTALDVVLRYAFNAPLSWGFDVVTNYLLVATFFFSFSFALRMGEHVAVDYFVPHFHESVRRWAMSVAWLACGALAAVVAAIAAREAFHAWRQGEIIAGVIPWPVWVQKLIIALGMAPLAIRLLLLAIGAVPHERMSKVETEPRASLEEGAP
ncbi:TRAP transporter small permease subunit [Ottowia sp.]|uniref:TRAP transporter small permease n=1 Tax=Ottowia sp. TaxID=1898956 RepID=UPI0026124130|nr:TRAP transporter small permease subunit [Ottowia sp.]